MQALKDHDWPGNIRQLKMTVSNLKGICVYKIITLKNVESILGVCVSKNEGSELLVPYKKFKNSVLSAAEKEYSNRWLTRHRETSPRRPEWPESTGKIFYEKLKQFGLTTKKNV